MGDSSNNVKVLGSWASPFVLRPRIALHLKSVNYEYIEENLLEGKSELLLKSNPVYKKVPVFFHCDNSIPESLIILQYIDEVWSSAAPSILPSDPYERAVSRFWAAYVDDKWFPALKATLAAETEDAKKAALAQVEEGLALLEEEYGKLSKGKPFFGGDQIGYLDIVFGCFLVWIQVIEKFNEVKLIAEDKTPGLFQWADRFCSHVAVKDVLPDVDELAQWGLKLRAKILKAKATLK
ncbi:hypothetical protein CCACVL1_03212 [Corchorus capsularis]|uniref:Glutathione S-transferase n=1 Tax=Corchorus capsularis TaxID=210143 RepID=A0A1R3K1Y1_COCAP|nr:hypothetical protein CCACVL1_03212 [Corchorus capsularis]